MQVEDLYAVLTGDIIRSSSLDVDKLDSVRGALVAAVSEIEDWRPGLVVGKPEFFRGDSWQLALADPGLGLRVSFFIRASLRFHVDADSRISVGVGSVERLNEDRVSLSRGDAFELSGHGLDEMNRGCDFVLRVAGESPDAWTPLIATLTDALVRQWTRRQAEIVGWALNPENWSHEEISQKLRPNVSKQAVSKALSGANWPTLKEALTFSESRRWG